VESESHNDRLAADGTPALTLRAETDPLGVATRLIVCERTGRWAVALRRELAGAGIRVWETRTLDDGWTELAQSPASFMVAELGHNVARLLSRMGRLPREFPAARLAVVADRSLASYERLMREAGAVHFVGSLRQVGPLARLACRHLAQVPPPQQSLTERIWASLPWAGTGGRRGKKDEK
jgi:hypothetical protein